MLFFGAALFAISTFAINPSRTYKQTPGKFALNYEEVSITTPDDYVLKSWVMQPISKRVKNTTIVIVGSDAGNMGGSLPYAYYLLKKGYRVVTFDYRGFGHSQDFAYQPDNMYHSEYITDFVAVMNWCKEQFGEDKIGILSFSMGTLVASVGYQQSPYNFFVGEGFISSPESVQKRVMIQNEKEVVLPASATEDGKQVTKLNIPILLFASSTDPVTTLKDSQVFCESRKNANVTTFDGEHLRGAASLGMQQYVNTIATFIEHIRKK